MKIRKLFIIALILVFLTSCFYSPKKEPQEIEAPLSEAVEESIKEIPKEAPELKAEEKPVIEGPKEEKKLAH